MQRQQTNKSPLNKNMSQISFNGSQNNCFCGLYNDVERLRNQNQTYERKIKQKMNQNLHHNSQFINSDKKRLLQELRQQNQSIQSMIKPSRVTSSTNYCQPNLFINDLYIQNLEQNNEVLTKQNQRLTKILIMRLKMAQQ